MSIHKTLNGIERVITFISLGAAWVCIPIMILVRSFDIVARQYISTPSNYFQWVEWRAFMFLVLLARRQPGPAQSQRAPPARPATDQSILYGSARGGLAAR